ncbi:type VII secretion target [Amycolatopsis albispora]|uniref:ESX-1 secretion-associated protein n=1 Tax=Amycolatopsis albispora TaxID=1804986 RepID=A0A344LIA1_9PSEU|nr:type VII secretion target [Amycolatopsis albispora]AXB47775.1 hypothetical protein A4R43_39415 [Amycolatopsis albispora]
MPDGGFKAKPDELVTHAGTVLKLGERLNQAGTKGGGVDLGIETYGIIGQAFSGDVREQIAETAAALNELGEGLTDFSEGIKEAGGAYERFEKEVQELLELFKED